MEKCSALSQFASNTLLYSKIEIPKCILLTFKAWKKYLG